MLSEPKLRKTNRMRCKYTTTSSRLEILFLAIFFARANTNYLKFFFITFAVWMVTKSHDLLHSQRSRRQLNSKSHFLFVLMKKLTLTSIWLRFVSTFLFNYEPLVCCYCCCVSICMKRKNGEFQFSSSIHCTANV